VFAEASEGVVVSSAVLSTLTFRNERDRREVQIHS
jgi:hypothetical protein